MLRRRRHIALLIAIRPSDEDVKPGGPLGAFREEQAMSRHRVSPSPFLSSSHNNTTQTVTLTVTLTSTFSLHYTNTHPTCNVVCPSSAWFENRPHSTPCIHLAWNPKHVIVQCVGIRTHTHTIFSLNYNHKIHPYCRKCELIEFF